MRRTITLITVCALLGAAAPSDPYLWLEDVHGARAMAWVHAENAKTLAVLQNDPLFPALYANALAIAQAKDRIPAPELLGHDVYNFWQDQDHMRGIWRRTSITELASASPAWDILFDLDAVAKAEHANWVWKGANCQWPSARHCLFYLSDGGEDAIVAREYDVRTKQFVTDGFSLPPGKQDAAWENDDALLVAREWSPGELTTSGYPYVVKRLRRGQPLADAVEVFRGSKTDGGYGVSTDVFYDDAGNSAVIIARPLSTFTFEYYLMTPSGPRRMNVPLKSQPSALIAGRLLFTLRQDWNAGGTAFHAGSLVGTDLAGLRADPANATWAAAYVPGPRETLSDVATTKSRLLLVTYDNVRARAWAYAPVPGGGWTKQRLDLPDNSTIGITASDPHIETAYLTATSFLVPPTLWQLEAATGVLRIVKTSPARFDASNDVVDQREAVSKDGTHVPYFIVHPKNMRLDGTNPTLLYAYGGFGVSLTPNYSGILGKLWLERGGVYVLANIRGGGEFGPAWHDAGLTVHRQRIYDDFTAVAEDLIATKVTSPRRLGIQGGSNGGLLMGVEFTQHPELWHAVDIQVPLLDMLRFEQIQAGESWTGEYGSVADPLQRAFLASISPYNNLKTGVAYPEPFIWTTTKDDRVGPQHARKFAAKLQAMGIPYLFYEVTEGGHSSGANLQERAFTSALEMTYMIRKLMY